jgi:cell division protein ZipA
MGMPELRWALALLGVLFLGGLAWWELRRPRQAARGELQPPAREPRSPSASAQPLVHREPSITLPEIRSREPMHELPTVDVVDDSLIGLRVDGTRGSDAGSTEPVESVDSEFLEVGDARENKGRPFEATDEPHEQVEPIVPAAEVQARTRSLLESASAAAAPAEPIVEWPEESERRVIALRLVAPGERFAGRAVRQALAAEGFVLGKFAIFHRGGPDGRAVVSVANLTKPGTFDPDSIDTQRFGGLNLFAVLPGPLPSVRAFDELVASARNLSERLQGALQDEWGEPLTPLRTAAIRESLAHDGGAS